MPLGSVSPFRPTGTVSVAGGTSSTSALLAGDGDSVVVTNASSGIAFVRLGSDPTVTASVGDMPVLPASRVILAANSLIRYAALLLPSGTGSVLFSRGDGSVV
jgi:hypothetical protein